MSDCEEACAHVSDRQTLKVLTVCVMAARCMMRPLVCAGSCLLLGGGDSCRGQQG